VRGVRRGRVGRLAGLRGPVRRAGGRAVWFQFQAARASEILAGHGRVEVDQQAYMQHRRAQRLECGRSARYGRDQSGAVDLVDRAEGVCEEFQRKTPLPGR